MPRQIPKIGDIFWVTLSDGRNAYGQILIADPALMNLITVAIFDSTYSSPLPASDQLDASADGVLTLQHVTRDQFNRGSWRRFGNIAPGIHLTIHPKRGTGAKVIGSGNLRTFLEAYHGLRSWTEMANPDYYTKLLFEGRKPPSRSPR